MFKLPYIQNGLIKRLQSTHFWNKEFISYEVFFFFFFALFLLCLQIKEILYKCLPALSLIIKSLSQIFVGLAGSNTTAYLCNATCIIDTVTW